MNLVRVLVRSVDTSTIYATAVDTLDKMGGCQDHQSVLIDTCRDGAD